jgi:hypothetical protein
MGADTMFCDFRLFSSSGWRGEEVVDKLEVEEQEDIEHLFQEELQ